MRSTPTHWNRCTPRIDRRRRTRAVLYLFIAIIAVPFGHLSAAPEERDGIDTVPIDRSVPPSQILAARPFVVPGDRCPIFCIAADSTAVPLDEAAARARLSRFLLARGASETVRSAALVRFDATDTMAIIPNPTLRAALLMLSGWAPYDAVVAAVLDGENQSGLPFVDVSFQAFDSGAVAFLGGTVDGGYALRVNREFAAEAPETLANVLIHETMHDPYENSYEEEVIANILDGVAYAEILLLRPELASNGTTLTVYNNFALLALLNSSGDAGPTRLGISTARFGDVWLGTDLTGSDASSLRDAIAGDNVYSGLPRGGTPGGPVLASLLAPFSDAHVPSSDPAFDERTLSVIDGGIGTVVSPTESVALATTLAVTLAAPTIEIQAETVGALPSDPDTILRSRPFIPRDTAFFDPAYGAEDRLAPRSARTAHVELSDHLSALGVEREARTTILDRFEDDDGSRITSPSLRAAAALLAILPGGTPVSDHLLSPASDASRLEPQDLITFAPMPHGTPFAITAADGNTVRIGINERLAGESLALLACTLLEATLSVPIDGSERATEDQAVLAAAVATVAYTELLIASPELAGDRTWLIARANRALLALVNSAPVRPDDGSDSPIGSVGLLDPAEGVADVLPNLYSDSRSFEAEVQTRPGATDLAATRRATASPLAVAAARALGVEMTAADESLSPTFGDLLFLFDARLGALLPPEAIARLAEALDLGVAKP